MKSKIMISILLIVIIILVVGCDFKLYNEPEVGEGNWREDFIATMNIDGSDVQLIQSQHQTSFAGARPYFVRDLAGNYDDEVILLDFASRIDIMSLDGEYRRTIIDSLGGVQYFNQDRTKMLLEKDGEIFICNVDGTELSNLTNTPYKNEGSSSFSYDERSIIYTVNTSDMNNDISEVHKHILMTNEVIVVFRHEEPILPSISTWITNSAEIASGTISYKFNMSDSSGNTPSINKLIKYNIHNNIVEEICTNLSFVKYSNSKYFLAYKWEGGFLVNLQAGDIIQLDINSGDPMFSFSSDDRYLMINEIIYDSQTDSIICIEDSDFFGKYHHISKTHMNSNNTKIVGIVGFLHY
ncbi:hypothetical protein JEZ13_05835 [bacterium]|nr:hypothetical protein [bacterium]